MWVGDVTDSTFSVPKEQWRSSRLPQYDVPYRIVSSRTVVGEAHFIRAERGCFFFETNELSSALPHSDCAIARPAFDSERYLLLLDDPDIALDALEADAENAHRLQTAAARESAWKVLKALLERFGQYADCPDEKGFTPLMHVLDRAKPVDTMRWLVKKMVDLNPESPMTLHENGTCSALTMAITRKRPWDVVSFLAPRSEVTDWCVKLALIYHSCKKCTGVHGRAPFRNEPCVTKLMLMYNTPESALACAIRAQSPFAVLHILRRHPAAAAKRTLRMDNGTSGTVYDAQLDGARFAKAPERADFILDVLVAFEDGRLEDVPERFRARRREMPALVRAVIRSDYEEVQRLADRERALTIASVGIVGNGSKSVDAPPRATALDVARRVGDARMVEILKR